MQIATVDFAALSGWRSAALQASPTLASSGYFSCLDKLRDSRQGKKIALSEFVATSENISNKAKNSVLGWQVGQNYDLDKMGDIGAAIQSSRHLGTALKRFAEYFFLLQDATELSIKIDDEQAQISYRILDTDIWPRHQDAMFSLGIVAQIIQKAAGADWNKVELSLECPAKDSCANMGSKVGTSVWFGGDTNSILFPASFLDLPLEFAERNDADMPSLNRALVDKWRATPVGERVRNSIYQKLADGLINQGKMASEIGMSCRTMRRKLLEEGMCFQEILDDCRMRQAIFEFRTNPEQSISQIALRLGYAEHSTFTRAFTRWAGQCPQSYRSQIQQAAN